MEQASKAVMVRKAVDVSSVPRGAGFRPFVTRLAQECGVTETISPRRDGVTIEVQGENEPVDRFFSRLIYDAPSLVKFSFLELREIDLDLDVLMASGPPDHTSISRDLPVCTDCLREMTNPRDRRFRYPFISCNNCGPRFTILRESPWDRAHSSMASFQMCAACQAEYHDPSSRRYHSLTNACWDCGPQVQLWSADGTCIDTPEPVREVARLLERDGIIAIKSIGGFHLACNARSETAVGLLRERKRHTEKPFATMFRRIEDVERVAIVDETARKLLLSSESPIVHLPRRLDVSFAAGVTPNCHFLAAFLPYTPSDHLLFSNSKLDALIMTGASLAEEPICIDNQECLQRLRGIADAFMMDNLDIVRRCPDSALRVTAGRVQQVRRSRGFVPRPVTIEVDTSEPVLALGGEQKNTICVINGNDAFLSQHIGDLENLESYKFFQESVDHLQRILEVHPKTIAYDLNSDYFSTKWARAQEGMRAVGVQHHHAHIAACMAENHLDGKVIGIALDGGGYGTDNAIWGGEVLLADYNGFERAAHLEYVSLPGGAAAIQEPWRTAVSYLCKHYGKLDDIDLPFLKTIDARRLHVVQQMIAHEIHAPRTSSCGRLFDAVSALIGVRSTASYEAQAATDLEMLGLDSVDEGSYPFALTPSGPCWQIGTRGVFDAMLGDIHAEESVRDISRRFHAGLAKVFVELAEKIRARSGLDRVCLSGDCFEDTLLFELLKNGLRAKSFEVYYHSEVPTGDGGLCLGQALIAAHAHTDSV
jgi:hydrogenase maturation protein HypF